LPGGSTKASRPDSDQTRKTAPESYSSHRQATPKYKIATPANWNLGEDVIIPPPGSCGSAKERVEKAGEDYTCLDWFLCLKKCPHG